MIKIYHLGRCGDHPDLTGPIGDTTTCDGSCLNEPCDSCGADTGQQCSPKCEDAAAYFEFVMESQIP
jgi:hypothetical protein